MRVIKLRKNNLRETVREAAESLKKGQVIIYPTDTLYGLGGDFSKKEVLESIRKIKKRTKNKPCSVIMRDFSMIKKYAQVSGRREKIMRANLPGRFTFILKAKNKLFSPTGEPLLTLGVRIPASPFTRELSRVFPRPYLSTSVNISGEDSLSDPAEIIKQFGHSLPSPDLFIDGGIIGTGQSIPVRFHHS